MGGVLLAIVPVVMIILPRDKSKLFYCSIVHYNGHSSFFFSSYFNLNVSHYLQFDTTDFCIIVL